MEHITVKEILEAVKGTLLCGNQDTPLNHISIDSRNMKGNDLFVPLIGERSDGHDYIGKALENGAAAVLTSRHEVPESTGEHPAYIGVEDTKKALQDIGRYYRGRLTLPLVGITGSVGKTTTREMVAAALRAGFQTFKTPANYNSQVGLPITLTEIGERDEVGVLELGMSEPGELTVIAKIAKVDMAVITNIGITHIEQLGSKEKIYHEKLSIQDGLKPGGILFLNGDDELLADTKGREGFRTIYYGTGSNCDYRAENISMVDGIPHFEAVYRNERVPVSLNVMGYHNIQNAMVALAVASQLKIPMEAAAVTLGEFTGFDNRQQVYRSNGITVIDDTYNASPASMKAAIEVLRALGSSKRKLAVLADMKELGPDSPAYHYEIGMYLAEHPVDMVLVLGDMAAEIARGVSENNKEIRTECFAASDSLQKRLQVLLREGDAVLFKGSNSMKLWAVASCFYKTSKE